MINTDFNRKNLADDGKFVRHPINFLSKDFKKYKKDKKVLRTIKKETDIFKKAMPNPEKKI